MKKLFRILAILLVITMTPVSLIACNDSSNNSETQQESTEMKDTEASTQKTTEKTTAKPTEKPTEKVPEGQITVDLASKWSMVKTLGRTTLSDNGIICDHSASGIEFCGTMKNAVYIDVVTSGVKSGCTTTYFTIYIDGERQPYRLSVEPGATELKIANFIEEGEHTITVVKQTESNYTICEIRSIRLEGELTTPPEQKQLYIEVIGDSLTCGMGNLGVNSSEKPQTPIWEDATQSYGYMIAQDLDADYSIISQSGIGIAGSWYDPLFDFYTKASYSRGKLDKKFDEDHSFFLRTPDIIVINLGTNDYFLNKNKDPNMCKPAEVRQKTEEFIELVRDSYGENVPIVWAYGFVGTYLYNEIKGAIDSLGGEDAGIYMCQVPKSTGGAQGHPTVEGHRAAADTLLPVIKEILGIEE